MLIDSRLLPASGAFPKPGQDISGTLWQQYMRSGEIALFTFDAKTGQPLTAKCEVPETPISIAARFAACTGRAWTPKGGSESTRM
jgi:hypothetical protein